MYWSKAILIKIGEKKTSYQDFNKGLQTEFETTTFKQISKLCTVILQNSIETTPFKVILAAVLV